MFTALHTSLTRNTVYINVITADNFFEIILSTILLVFCIFSAAKATNIQPSTENAAPIMTEYIFFTKYGTADSEKDSVHKTIIVCSCLTDIFLFSNVFIIFSSPSYSFLRRCKYRTFFQHTQRHTHYTVL